MHTIAKRRDGAGKYATGRAKGGSMSGMPRSGRTAAHCRRLSRFTPLLLGIPLTMLSGCVNPAAEMNQIRTQFDQIPPTADRGAVAFVLGLPTVETKDRSAWLYVQRDQSALASGRPQRMIVVRFDQRDRCIYRELMLWRRAADPLFELHYEIEWTDPNRATDSDLPAIVHDKLEQLARADAGMSLDSQPASFQFHAGERLVVSMQRWEQGDVRMARLTASVPSDGPPRLVEALTLSCRVRLLSAGIEFDQPLVRELR